MLGFQIPVYNSRLQAFRTREGERRQTESDEILREIFVVLHSGSEITSPGSSLQPVRLQLVTCSDHPPAAARSRVWTHTTTCCDTSFDVAQQHVQRSENGRVANVSECGGPVRIIYQPSVTRHSLVQARNGVRSIGPISTRIAVQPPSCRWCPRRGMAATHGQPWCQ